ncbi:LysR family transcriptional regulator [Stenotrophomonas sp. MMGLT7]|uniref:LysR family transcriptional regulator n=1 Tax=Stenotrophomonas sp. MMGLT7 TaxID=2901227 RepID=UPI001E4B3492|nr:LysR family transcriptional regulator [Stenotrophomonas sp. MMGLT7]
MSSSRYAELEAFQAILHHGSFTAAASALGVTPGAITRRIGALEASLGVKLLNRTTRRLSLTEPGRHYYAEIAPALAQLEAAAERTRALSTQPQGELRVSLPMNFGRLHVMPHLPDFLQRWPRITVDAQFEDRYVDVIGEGYDLAVRIGALQDSRLVAHRLADTRRILVAAPGYLAARGTPRLPGELVAHDCLHYTLFRDTATWEFHRGRERQRIAVRGPLKSNYGEPLVGAAVRGLGIVQTATFAVAQELADGRLCEILADWSLVPIAIHAVYPDRDYRPRKVDAFLAFLHERLGQAS